MIYVHKILESKRFNFGEQNFLLVTKYYERDVDRDFQKEKNVTSERLMQEARTSKQYE